MPLRDTAPESIQERLRPLQDGRFRFACHPSVPCFTECCRDLRLMLTPYDIVRLKSHLNMTAEAFVDEYCEIRFDEKRGLPMIHLAMKDDERKTCPFVSPQGCGIYPDRPGACRIYPIARASRLHKLHGTVIENYFLLQEAHCRGFEEDRCWTIEQWVSDQGLEIYHDMNNLWMEIITDDSLGKRVLTEKQRQMFFMASYDVEKFRHFVFIGRFLQLFEVSEEEVMEFQADDRALLKLALKWLGFSLLGKPTLTLRKEPA